MSVYVVLGRTPYEGDMLIAVYASLVEAEAAVDVFEVRGVPYDGSAEGYLNDPEEPEYEFHEYVITERQMGVIPEQWHYEQERENGSLDS